jgi:hypothetical protein
MTSAPSSAPATMWMTVLDCGTATSPVCHAERGVR